jgi:hypothetical protein
VASRAPEPAEEQHACSGRRLCRHACRGRGECREVDPASGRHLIAPPLARAAVLGPGTSTVPPALVCLGRWRHRAPTRRPSRTSSLSLCGEGLAEQGRSAWSADRPATLAVGWTLPPWTAVRPGIRVVSSRPGGHPSGRSPPRRTLWPDWVVHHSYSRPTRTDGRLQATRGTRPAVRPAAVAVRLGVCSRRPAGQARVSIVDGGPGRCPSGVRPSTAGASIPTAGRAGRCRRTRGAGAGERRGGAWPRPPDHGRRSTATSRWCSRPSRTPPRGAYRGPLGTFLHSGAPRGAVHGLYRLRLEPP